MCSSFHATYQAGPGSESRVGGRRTTSMRTSADLTDERSTWNDPVFQFGVEMFIPVISRSRVTNESTLHSLGKIYESKLVPSLKAQISESRLQPD